MATPRPRKLVSVQEHLRDQIGHELRTALIAGELRPGEIYSAPALAAQYGVSATPVREAMLDLVREGLVEAVRNKGFRITRITERDLGELTEIRALIEVPTVGRITRSATREELEALRPAAEESVAAARAYDLVAYSEADRRFHRALLALAGNDHLLKVVGDLRTRSRLHGPTEPDGALVDAARQHIELLEIMLDGDSAAAEAHMRHHLEHGRSLRAARRPVPAQPTAPAAGHPAR